MLQKYHHHNITLTTQARESYNVYGFWLEDYFACMVMWPFVASQMSLQAKAVEPVFDINADPNEHMQVKAREVGKTSDSAGTLEFVPVGFDVAHPLVYDPLSNILPLDVQPMTGSA